MDTANGAAYTVAPEVFTELGAQLSVIHNQPNGLNINKDCGATHPENIREIIKKEKADIGICLDGDADRLIVCDENGEIVDGDYILTFCALKMMKEGKLRKNTLVVTGYSNLGVDDVMKKNNGKVSRTENGDRYVIEEMKKHNYNLGGEASGHIIFMDYTTTGDGIISGLQLIKHLKESGMKASELKKCIKKYPQTLVSIEVKEKKPFDKLLKVNSKIKQIEKELKGEGRLLLRYSGTQNVCRIMIEGKDKEKIETMTKELEILIKNEVGI